MNVNKFFDSKLHFCRDYKLSSVLSFFLSSIHSLFCSFLPSFLLSVSQHPNAVWVMGGRSPTQKILSDFEKENLALLE